MIVYQKKFLRIAEYWDGEEPEPGAVDLVRCFQQPQPLAGMLCRDFHTILLDLNRDPRLPPADGSLDAACTAGSGPDNSISSIVVQSDGKLLIGGLFKTVNGETRRGIARLSPDGTLDTGFQNCLSGIMGAWINDPAVYSVALQTNGKVVIGGRFNTVNGTPAVTGAVTSGGGGRG